MQPCIIHMRISTNHVRQWHSLIRGAMDIPRLFKTGILGDVIERLIKSAYLKLGYTIIKYNYIVYE